MKIKLSEINVENVIKKLKPKQLEKLTWGDFDSDISKIPKDGKKTVIVVLGGLASRHGT